MFNPSTAARQVLAETTLTDPDDIAEVVYERIPDDEVADVCRHLLRHSAREAIRLSSMGASEAPRTVPQKSSRVAAIRSTHISYYDQRVFASGEWKMLRHCTRTDVLDLAQQRQEVADRNLAKVAEYNALHERMKSAGVEYVGQLESEVAA